MCNEYSAGMMITPAREQVVEALRWHFVELEAARRKAARRKAKAEATKRELLVYADRSRELLSQARKPPCEQCLRPHSPCKQRCLRSMLKLEDFEAENL